MGADAGVKEQKIQALTHSLSQLQAELSKRSAECVVERDARIHWQKEAQRFAEMVSENHAHIKNLHQAISGLQEEMVMKDRQIQRNWSKCNEVVMRKEEQLDKQKEQIQSLSHTVSKYVAVRKEDA